MAVFGTKVFLRLHDQAASITNRRVRFITPSRPRQMPTRPAVNNLSLILLCAVAVAGCTSANQELKPTASYISKAEVESANTCRLTPQERVKWEKRTADADRKEEAPTTEYITDFNPTHWVGPQIYDLSPRKRRLCEQRAANGDIIAAKTLVEYHEMITRDSKQYHYWLKVVERLQREYLKRQEARRR